MTTTRKRFDLLSEMSHTPPLTSVFPFISYFLSKKNIYEAPNLSELLLGETQPKPRASSTEELVREPVA